MNFGKRLAEGKIPQNTLFSLIFAGCRLLAFYSNSDLLGGYMDVTTKLDLSNKTIKRLAYLKAQRNCSYADLMREAVEQYLERQSNIAISNAPGLWQGCEEDGIEFQSKLREEW